MKKMTKLFLLSIISVCAVQANFTFAADGATGFVADRLDRIDDTVKAEIAAGKIPGAVAMIVRNGRTVYHKSFGYADIATKTPMQNDSIFRIASMTKAITSVGVMTLYERGHFQLNDPISKYIPEFADPQVLVSANDDGVVTETRPAKREIRIIDLLTHSAGLGYPFINSPVQKVYIENGIIDGLTEKDVRLEDQMVKLAEMPLLFDPGSAWNYGLNTDLLGRLIEVVSGKSLAQYFADEIFTPLTMTDTHFYLPAKDHDRLVSLYAGIDGELVPYTDESMTDLGDTNYPRVGAMTYYSGGAGLSSTAYDYARFIQMLLNDGELDGTRILGRKSVELMRSPRIDMDGDGTAEFGLGFQVIGDIGKSGELGSTGIYQWGGAFNTSYWIDPAENMIAVFMSQIRPSQTDITSRFKTLVYQALE
jgi:CubicO group peptidase (beta-lactamase class C family)